MQVQQLAKFAKRLSTDLPRLTGDKYLLLSSTAKSSFILRIWLMTKSATNRFIFWLPPASFCLCAKIRRNIRDLGGFESQASFVMIAAFGRVNFCRLRRNPLMSLPQLPTAIGNVLRGFPFPFTQLLDLYATQREVQHMTSGAEKSY